MKRIVAVIAANEIEPYARATCYSIMLVILNEAKICSLEEEAEEEIMFENDENAKIMK